MKRFLDSLTECGLPHYGILMQVTLVVSALALSSYFLSVRPDIQPNQARVKPATVVSFLPDSILQDRRWQLGFGCALALSALPWLARWLLPWSGWTFALSYLFVVALYLEQVDQATHVGHLTAQLLLVYALWFHLYAADMKQARAERRFWTTPLYPRWVYSLSVLAVGLFYGWSGLSKILESGFGWVNGVSLQLWVSLWGDPDSIWTRLVLADRRLAWCLQAGTLVVELGGLIAIVSQRLRPWIGLGLLGLHFGIVSVFGWAFHFNALLVALVFLPVYPRLTQWSKRALPHPHDTGVDGDATRKAAREGPAEPGSPVCSNHPI